MKEDQKRKKRKKLSPEERLAKRYTMSPDDLAQHDKKVAKTKAKYSMDAAEVEKALTDYLEIKDPIVVDGKAIMWCKRPSMKQLKELIPQELRPYENPEDVPEELNKKYELHFYEKMAEIIAIPEKTAEEWRKIANPWFARLFWGHIKNIAEQLDGRIEGF